MSVGDAAIEVGSSLTLDLLDNISVGGTVRWIVDGDVGVEFTIRIHETMLQVLIDRADKVLLFPARRPMPLQDRFGRALPGLGGGRNSRLRRPDF